MSIYINDKKNKQAGYVQHLEGTALINNKIINLNEVERIYFSKPSASIQNILVWEKNPPIVIAGCSLEIFKDSETQASINLYCDLSMDPVEKSRIDLVEVELIVGFTHETFKGRLEDKNGLQCNIWGYEPITTTGLYGGTINIKYNNELILSWDQRGVIGDVISETISKTVEFFPHPDYFIEASTQKVNEGNFVYIWIALESYGSKIDSNLITFRQEGPGNFVTNSTSAQLSNNLTSNSVGLSISIYYKNNLIGSVNQMFYKDKDIREDSMVKYENLVWM